MENLKTFESFNDPNKKEKKHQLSSHITKSDVFSLLDRDEKNFIKPLAGKELTDFTIDVNGNYLIKTDMKKYPTIKIPKRLVLIY